MILWIFHRNRSSRFGAFRAFPKGPEISMSLHTRIDFSIYRYAFPLFRVAERTDFVERTFDLLTDFKNCSRSKFREHFTLQGLLNFFPPQRRYQISSVSLYSFTSIASDMFC